MDELRARLLSDINRDVPKGLDWRAGALAYVKAEVSKHEWYKDYMLLKPLSRVPSTAFEPQIAENYGYLSNFASCFQLLALPGGSRILDVACGSGWLGHFFGRMGYDAYGFDIAPDMIDIARTRFRDDKLLSHLHDDLDQRLFVLDIEQAPLPASLQRGFDAIILESCAHHFFDPLAAFTNLANGLNEGGVMVIIEGERRIGELKREYVSVMEEFATLERPYSRDQMEGILSFSGLAAWQFLGKVPDCWIAHDDPKVDTLPEIVRSFERHLNLVVAAKTEGSLRRIFPHRNQVLEPVEKPKELEISEIDQVRARIEAIEASTSWRVTAPLRKLASIIRS